MQKAIINTEKRSVCNISFYFCATKLQLFIQSLIQTQRIFIAYSFFLRLKMDMTAADKGKLRPEEVFECFSKVNQVPRPSKKEDKMIAFLMDFGLSLGLDTQKDATGNVLIRKPATPGYENLETLVLQCHMDMVCEKNRDVDFNFETDAIQTYVDGDWLKAKGTTLGADDGIGVAMCMAVLQSKQIEHGPIECLFTRDEETGLTGAMGLEPGFVKGKFLINLDSEDEGQIFVSCAGGARTTATFSFREEALPAGYFTIKVTVKGLTGGHSGDDINKKRANANKMLARYLYRLMQKTDVRIVDIQNSKEWKHDFKDGKGLIEGAYGPYFIRLSVPGHKGIGIHGTHDSLSIGSRVTEGCIRLKNDDLIQLVSMIEIPMTVVITPSAYDEKCNINKKQ